MGPGHSGGEDQGRQLTAGTVGAAGSVDLSRRYRILDNYLQRMTTKARMGVISMVFGILRGG
jgi:hypothetical protein